MTTVAGFERKTYVATAGTKPTPLDDTTLLPHVVDVGKTLTNETFEDTDRGDSSAVPKVTNQVVARAMELSLVMTYWKDDTIGATLIAAAEAGTPIALFMVRYEGGPEEFDGDVIATTTDDPGALKEGSQITFTLTPTRAAGRTWYHQTPGP